MAQKSSALALIIALCVSPFFRVAGAPCIRRCSHVSVGQSSQSVHFALASCESHAYNLDPLPESKLPLQERLSHCYPVSPTMQHLAHG